MRDYVHNYRNYFYDPIIEPPGPDKVDPMGKNVLQLVIFIIFFIKSLSLISLFSDLRF